MKSKADAIFRFFVNEQMLKIFLCAKSENENKMFTHKCAKLLSVDIHIYMLDICIYIIYINRRLRKSAKLYHSGN